MPGKPRCRVASREPTSTPSSRAFVAATAHSLPSNSARSICRRSCPGHSAASAHSRATGRYSSTGLPGLQRPHTLMQDCSSTQVAIQICLPMSLSLPSVQTAAVWSIPHV